MARDFQACLLSLFGDHLNSAVALFPVVFEQFLHRPRVEILLPTMETTQHYANLYRQLRTAGTPIPTNDLWVAAVVVQYNLTLFSRDVHFGPLPQIPTIAANL